MVLNSLVLISWDCLFLILYNILFVYIGKIYCEKFLIVILRIFYSFELYWEIYVFVYKDLYEYKY